MRCRRSRRPAPRPRAAGAERRSAPGRQRRSRPRSVGRLCLGTGAGGPGGEHGDEGVVAGGARRDRRPRRVAAAEGVDERIVGAHGGQVDRLVTEQGVEQQVVVVRRAGEVRDVAPGRRCPPGRRRARRGRRPWSRRRLLGLGMRAHRRYRRPPDLPPTPPAACSGRSGPDGRRRRRAVPGSARLPSSRPTPGPPHASSAQREPLLRIVLALYRVCVSPYRPHPSGRLRSPRRRPGIPTWAERCRRGPNGYTLDLVNGEGYPAGRVLSVHPEQ